jgi:hypothetical protein
MATTTTNFGWDIPQSTDLVKDGATAIAALGQDIDTAMVDLKGGTTGQVLAKASGTDLDFSWVAQDDSNAIQNAIVDAKGDLIAATAADTPARLAVGTNGQVLVADSTAATGLKWETPAPTAAGLTLISTTALSAVTSQSINSVFSSTYQNYLILFTLDSSSGNGDYVNIRLRASGTDATGSNYFRAGYGNNGSAVNVNTTSTSFIAGITNTAGYGAAELILFKPNEAAPTRMNSQWTAYGDTTFILSGQHTVSTAYDGITIYSAYTMTGSVSIYGYSK